LEIRGGLSDWRKVNAESMLMQFGEDKCQELQVGRINPDSDTEEGLAGEQLCGKGLEVVGQQLSMTPSMPWKRWRPAASHVYRQEHGP